MDATMSMTCALVGRAWENSGKLSLRLLVARSPLDWGPVSSRSNTGMPPAVV
jgi:hypothetical protein